MIELRVLSVDDRPLWRELRPAALAEAPYAFGSRSADWQGEGDRPERWRARLGMPGSRNLVAAVDGRPAGMAGGVPTGEPAVAELISVWVSPAARGRGIGDLLVGEVVRWAEEAGASVLRLAVADGDRAAAALYRRNGFRDTGGLGDPTPDGTGRERLMERELGAAAR